MFPMRGNEISLLFRSPEREIVRLGEANFTSKNPERVLYPYPMFFGSTGFWVAFGAYRLAIPRYALA